MVSERREVAAVCQRCGGTRGGERYCPHCGLDFWKAAEEDARGTAAADPPPIPGSVTTSGGTPMGLVAIGVGVSLLAVAVLVWIVAGSGLLRDGTTGPQLGQQPPPAVHPLLLDFFAEARNPEAAFAWRQTGTATLAIPDQEFVSTVDVAGRADGEDWAAQMRMVEDGEAVFDGRFIYVSQHGYVREGDDPWTETGVIPAVQLGPVNPFARITTVGELEYVGPETRDGVDGHVITTDKWLSDPEVDDPIRRVAHVRSRESLMEIFVGSDGVPLSAVYTFAIEARTPAGETVTFRGESRYEFKVWGAVDPIVAPSAKPAP
jgi:hypothetical protein